MAIEKLQQKWQQLKNAWAAAKVVARGKGIKIQLKWDGDPLADSILVFASPGNTINVTEMMEIARRGAVQCLDRGQMKLAEPGDPNAFLVKWKHRP